MGAKMSSSDPDSKIDVLDDAKTVERKIKKAFCEEGNITENGLLSFAKFVLYPLFQLQGRTTGLSFQRKPEFGGDVNFPTYEALEEAFKEKLLHPGDMKKGVAAAINGLLEPVRQMWAKRPDLQELTAKAYPEAKKEKQAGGGRFYLFCDFINRHFLMVSTFLILALLFVSYGFFLIL
jgi:tyrosyl-tRNA synthetase